MSNELIIICFWSLWNKCSIIKSILVFGKLKKGHNRIHSKVSMKLYYHSIIYNIIKLLKWEMKMRTSTSFQISPFYNFYTLSCTDTYYLWFITRRVGLFHYSIKAFLQKLNFLFNIFFLKYERKTFYFSRRH